MRYLPANMLSIINKMLMVQDENQLSDCLIIKVIEPTKWYYISN